MIRKLILCAAAILIGSASGAASASRPSVLEYSSLEDPHGAVLIKDLGSWNTPSSLSVTDDDALWFIETFAWHPRIARLDRNHRFTEFSMPQEYWRNAIDTWWIAQRFGVLAAHGNGVVVANATEGPMRVAIMNASGNVTEMNGAGCLVAGPNYVCLRSKHPIRNPWGKRPNSATLDRAGNIWFTSHADSLIGRIGQDGRTTTFVRGLSRFDSGPQFITAGPDGNLWFTEMRDRIGRITPDGKITEFAAGIPWRASLGGILTGCDGNLWFTLYHGMVLGRITPLGAVRLYHDLVYPSTGHIDDPVAMMVRDKQGRLYYNEGQAGRIARATIPCRFRR